ncbi:anhydro-N-acetylmuramic acid kinase [Aureisphaera sp. CAU 1614]|uniref:Anhydro-N-acetylmuramic acid kinase n=1 Tax=Halomarinibacterium sedimenti TaxID=2857106 RepID=A0A9X1FQM5_9FLAO|nr:anhydro-N-acetylmuramic acid kinase [Halomarinibacterium sedimenti]MBW2938801.1 anhydro-N-acetylmuramic acid kinase [Halomarinibacterium sedimenti]
MKKTKYRVIGVMSGTSLDGIDLALCAFHVSEKGEWDFTIEVAETIPYSEDWKEILKEAIHFSEGRLQTLNKEYTYYLSEVITTFIEKHSITNLEAVCSHGHTILHEPHKGITLQIGNLPLLAKRIQQKVVCDFRIQDVVMGGQGAPLVPIGDRLLFSANDYCLNLGGFANVSFEEKEKRIAYDICPVNIVMNFYAEKLGTPFDKSGTFAERGTLNTVLLSQLNMLSFYSEKPPKSLGLEWVQQYIFPLLEASKETPQNILRTFVEHVAMQLSNQFKENSSIFITGGGAYNTFLLERLKAQKSLNIIVPNSQILEFKEALVFGLLGVLKLRNEVNCLASVTGAKDDHSSGILFNP